MCTLPVIELVSRIRARPFHSGFLEYYVCVHHCGGIGRTNRGCVIHRHRGSVGYGGHGKRRSTGGHHRVNCRAPAHHLLHDCFFVAAQASWNDKVDTVISHLSSLTWSKSQRYIYFIEIVYWNQNLIQLWSIKT